MYLEGCKWDSRHHILADSDPKKLFTDIPLILLVPQADREIPKTVRLLFSKHFLGNIQHTGIQSAIKSRYSFNNWTFNQFRYDDGTSFKRKRG